MSNRNNRSAKELIEELKNHKNETIKPKQSSNRKKTILTTTALILTAVATVVTPVVVYRKRNESYEISIHSEVLNFETYSITVKRGETISTLKQKLNVFEGHVLVGVYKDQECKIPYEDTEKVTKNTKIYLKYEKEKFNVTVSNGVIIIREDKSNLSSGEKLLYGEKVTVSFEETEGFVMETFKINGVEYNENGVEIEVKEDLNITYNEVNACGLSFELNPNGTGYIVSDYDGGEPNVIVPSKVYNKPVVEIPYSYVDIFGDGSSVGPFIENGDKVESFFKNTSAPPFKHLTLTMTFTKQ